ncbi:MAG: right-handed parallel beta-helix repeat-containing protein [Bryobacterales bacterium]|nr:right-handed parallel beta-helix repeat-containing protein [Bryobacterales bacterium]
MSESDTVSFLRPPDTARNTIPAILLSWVTRGARAAGLTPLLQTGKECRPESPGNRRSQAKRRSATQKRPGKGHPSRACALTNLEFHHTTHTLGHIEARVQTDAAVMLTNASRKSYRRLPVREFGCLRHLASSRFPRQSYRPQRDLGRRCGRCAAGLCSPELPGRLQALHARTRRRQSRSTWRPDHPQSYPPPRPDSILLQRGSPGFAACGHGFDGRKLCRAQPSASFVTQRYLCLRNQGGKIFEYNRIEEIMLDVEDGGAIHVATMNQLAAPNIIRNNLIANVWGWRQLPSGGRERHIARGVYLDWFAASTHSENNIVYNTKTGGLQVNAGDDNHFLNNVVVGDGTAWNIHWQKANAQGTRDERNLVIKDMNTASPFENADAGDFRLRRTIPGAEAHQLAVRLRRAKPLHVQPQFGDHRPGRDFLQTQGSHSVGLHILMWLQTLPDFRL